MEDDPQYPEIERCSTVSPCYNTDNKYDNTMCSDRESCAAITKVNGEIVAACILSKYCEG